MKKKFFNLQEAEFSDSSDEDKLIPNSLIEMYNKEYSLVLN